MLSKYRQIGMSSFVLSDPIDWSEVVDRFKLDPLMDFLRRENMAKKTKKRPRATLALVALEVKLEAEAVRITDLTNALQHETESRRAEQVKALNARGELEAVLNAPFVMNYGRRVPVAVLEDTNLLHRLHVIEREARDPVQRYGAGGELVDERRGLISPVYNALLEEAETRGLIRRCRNAFGAAVTDRTSTNGEARRR